MGTTRKIVIGLGVASGALLAAWLLSGDRGKKVKEFISKKASGAKNLMKKEGVLPDETESGYI